MSIAAGRAELYPCVLPRGRRYWIPVGVLHLAGPLRGADLTEHRCDLGQFCAVDIRTYGLVRTARLLVRGGSAELPTAGVIPCGNVPAVRSEKNKKAISQTLAFGVVLFQRDACQTG